MIIAHDLGTTGNKASLHHDDGRLVASSTASYPTNYAEGGVAEQDPHQWWQAVCTATRELLQRTNIHPGRVSAVGCSGQMMGAVPLDSHYDPVGPALIWADHRSDAEATALEAHLGADHAYRTLGHRLQPTYSLTKMMWLRKNAPQRYAKIAHFCLAKDFVVYRLTGVLVTDHTDASSTNAYDQTQRRWSGEILTQAGIDPALLPEIVASTTVVGTVTPHAATDCGLLAGTPVVAGGGDGPLAALGAGVIDPEDGAYTYLGSSSWISMSAHQPLHDPQRRSMTFDHVVPHRYVPTATMQAGGASLEWAAEVITPTGHANDRFTALLAEAATTETDGLYFLPHLMGERSPHWDPHARGAFVGLARHHDQAHLVRAVLEGVAFNLASCLTAFRDAGHDVNQVDAIGGGAASDLWLQILADTWGTTIRRRSIGEGANSLGAAVTAAVGTNLVPDFSVARSLSQITATFTPDPTRHADYQRRHAAFQELYSRLEPWFAKEAR